MQDFERQILEYHPELEIRRRVLSVIQSESVTQEQAKQLPENLLKSTALLRVDVVEHYNQTEKELEEVIDEASKCFPSSRVVNGITFDEYKQAREDEDYEGIQQFEDYHNYEIGASSAGELLPCLLDAYRDLQEHKKYINDMLYDGTAEFDQVEKYRKAEESAIVAVITTEMKYPGVQDLTHIINMYHLLEAANNRLFDIRNFVIGAWNVLKHDYSAQFNGDAEGAVKELIYGGKQNLGKLQSVIEIQFRKEAFTSGDNKARYRRLNTRDVRTKMTEEVKVLFKHKTEDMNPLLKWFNDINTNDDQAGISNIMEHAINGLESVNNTMKARFDDLFKMNTLEDIQRQDILNSLMKKKEIRRTYKLISSVLAQVDFADSDVNSQARQFVVDNGLEGPVDICE